MANSVAESAEMEPVGVCIFQRLMTPRSLAVASNFELTNTAVLASVYSMIPVSYITKRYMSLDRANDRLNSPGL